MFSTLFSIYELNFDLIVHSVRVRRLLLIRSECEVRFLQMDNWCNQHLNESNLSGLLDVGIIDSFDTWQLDSSLSEQDIDDLGGLLEYHVDSVNEPLQIVLVRVVDLHVGQCQLDNLEEQGLVLDLLLQVGEGISRDSELQFFSGLSVDSIYSTLSFCGDYSG